MIEGVLLHENSQAQPNIASLTAAMARGEEPAYREFFALYFDRLLRYLVVVTRDEERAREVLQLTLVRVARHVRQFESEEVFWSWLTTLARSAAIDEQRKGGRYLTMITRFFRQKQAEQDEVKPEDSTPLAELLEENLTELEDEERELIRRKYEEGESVKEMALRMGTTEKAIESRLGRVRRKLKEKLFSQMNHGK